MSSLALASVLLLLATACGSESASEPGEPAGPATELRVTLWPEGRDAQNLEWTLTCEPAGGSHPSPEAACSALSANSDALDPDPPDLMCTQIYGGPEQAEVSGIFRGRKIAIELSRANGCAIARWDRLQQIVEPSA